MLSSTSPPQDEPTTSHQINESWWKLPLNFNNIKVTAAFVLALLGLFLSPSLAAQDPSPTENRLSAVISSPPFTLTPAPTITPSPTVTPSPTAPATETVDEIQDVIILSIREGGYSRLFAYRIDGLPLTRLTAGPWDDITPAIHPNQDKVAFASNRSGQWDLFLLDLISAEVTRLTDSPEYEAAPSWSPDGRYLAYETYLEDDLEIAILDITGEQPIARLTDHPGADFSPTWSPQGGKLAFVSSRNGKNEIWLAELDRFAGWLFTRLNESPSASIIHPAWSPDGSQLAWSAKEAGLRHIYVWEEGAAPRYLGSGDYAVWKPDGTTLLTIVNTPHHDLLTAYRVVDSIYVLPPWVLPGRVTGMTWGMARLPSHLPEKLEQHAQITPTPLWLTMSNLDHDIPGGRQDVVPLDGIEAPYSMLVDSADEAFQALRWRTAYTVGWDFLLTLENAFVPLTASLPPGMGDDWLYTGRAFALSPYPFSASWAVVVREDFGADTYWRIYLKTWDQDGSKGKPLNERPWDFLARSSGDLKVFEQGGKFAEEIPDGYWIDFTSLAEAYGWERLPALPTWRSSYSATRFNEFVLRNNLEWRQAMLELYPAEALVTPTLFVPPTITPTPAPAWYRTPTPTAPPIPIQMPGITPTP
jgi:TolB protein